MDEPRAGPKEEGPAPGTQELPRTADRDALDASWQGEAPVLCLAGRWPLDEATSTMLAQLLEKHGLGGRVESYSVASRSGIETLDMTGVAMICVCYLDITGSPAYLRYLIRCLKHKAQDIPILVGLWPAEDSALKDKKLQKQIGADYFTTSLGEAINACVDVAQNRKQAST